jgi:hypothetical protein
MQVTLDEIKTKFKQLINKELSREAVSNWAIELRRSEDDGQLEYIPTHEEQRIWRAISYLTGVDLLDMDGSYLHSIENYIDFRNELRL